MKLGKLITGNIDTKAKNYSQMPVGNITPDRDNIRKIVDAPDDTSSKLDGMIRYNTDKNKLEVHHLGVWTELITLMDLMRSEDMEFYDPKGNATIQELARMLSEFFRVEMGSFDIVHNVSAPYSLPAYDDLTSITAGLPEFVKEFNTSSSVRGPVTYGTVIGIDVSRAYVEPILGDAMLNTIKITDGGSGYVEPPEVYIYGGGGVGASVRAIISDGKVVDLKIISRGVGYTSKPDVLIEGGGGMGARVDPIDLTLGDGKILGMKILYGGAGYTNLPQYVIQGTRTNDAIVKPIIDNGTIVGFDILDQGSGYTSDCYLTLPKLDSYMRTSFNGRGSGEHQVWFKVNFQFDIFTAAGVSSAKKRDYKINLFSGLTKYFDWVNSVPAESYAGIPIIRSANMKPLWSNGPNMYDDPNYGKFDITVELHGAAAYYSSAVAMTWVSQLTKFRNF